MRWPAVAAVASAAWSDVGCSGFFVRTDLLVLGSLVVRDRLQIFSSTNLSSYDEVNDTHETYHTRHLSKFISERCTRAGVHHGDLHIPSASLLVGGGSLIVLGHVQAGAISIDSAATLIVVNGAATVNSTNSVASIRNQLARKLPATACSQKPINALAIDVASGMLYLKHGSALMTYGTVKAGLVTLDEASVWKIVCGSIFVPQGDLAVLGGSELIGVSEAASLACSRFLLAEAAVVRLANFAVQVEALCKIDTASKLDLLDASTFRSEMAIVLNAASLHLSNNLPPPKPSDRHQLRPLEPTINFIVTDILAILEAGRIEINSPVAASITGLEASGAGSFTTVGNLQVQKNVLLDHMAELSVLGRSTKIGGDLQLTNHSQVVLAVSTDVVVGGSTRVLGGSSLKLPSAGLHVGCSFRVEEGSNLVTRGQLSLRKITHHEECPTYLPLGVASGGSQLEAADLVIGELKEQLEPALLMVKLKSSIETGGFSNEAVTLYLLLENNSKMVIQSKSLPQSVVQVGLAEISQGSELRWKATGQTVKIERALLRYQSTLSLKAASVTIGEFLGVARAAGSFRSGASARLLKSINVADRSTFDISSASLTFHNTTWLATGHSAISVVTNENGKCSNTISPGNGTMQCRDRSHIDLGALVQPAGRFLVSVETQSSLKIPCGLRSDFQVVAEMTEDSILLLPDQWQDVATSATFSLSVPASEASGYKSISKRVGGVVQGTKTRDDIERGVRNRVWGFINDTLTSDYLATVGGATH